MSHLTIMKLMSHIDEAIDILIKHDYQQDAEVLALFSKKYRIMYQLTVRKPDDNS